MDYTMRVTLDIFPIFIYVNDNSMADILFLNEVADSFRVTMHTKEYNTVIIHHSKNKACRFK